VNLRQMEAFRAIMREGTVTDAAKLLGLSQPSATELLKHTEAKLGFRLFDRFKGRLRPTPGGTCAVRGGGGDFRARQPGTESPSDVEHRGIETAPRKRPAT
jgi:hypothetical protein